MSVLIPLLWTVDLAMWAERLRPPAAWRTSAPAVTRLAGVGPDRWVAGSHRRLKLFDDSGKLVRDLSPPKPRRAPAGADLVFPTAGGVFVSAEPEATSVYAAASGALVHRWTWPAHAVHAAVAGDGSHAAVLTEDGVVHVLDVASGRSRHRLAHPRPPGAEGWCALAAGVVASTWGDAVRLWDLATGEPIAVSRHKHRGLELTPDGARVLTYTAKGFAIWDVATRRTTVQRSTVENTPDPARVLAAGVLRPRRKGDPPFFERHWHGAVWLDAQRRVTMDEPLDEALPATVRLSRHDATAPARIVARGALPGRASRIALTFDRRLVLVGDRSSRVHAFEVPC